MTSMMLRVSYPFTLQGEPNEYCGSVGVDDTHLTLHNIQCHHRRPRNGDRPCRSTNIS